MRINNSNNSISPSTTPKDEKVTSSTGPTEVNRPVAPIEANKQKRKAASMGSKPTRSLVERNINPVADIATPEDFQPAIDRIEYLKSVRKQIDATAPSSDAAEVSLSVFAANNSINYASNEQMLAEGTTPFGAKTQLEKAFGTIKKMQDQNSNPNEFSKVDIALALAEQKNRAILQPHIETVFGKEENKRKK